MRGFRYLKEPNEGRTFKIHSWILMDIKSELCTMQILAKNVTDLLNLRF
jgi:hypothetical protein